MKKITFVCFSICCLLFGVAFGQDGTLDTSFGDNGITITDIDGERDFTADLTISQDNTIWVACVTEIGGNLTSIVVRYLEDGARDLDFSTNGALVFDALDNSRLFKLFSFNDGTVLVGRQVADVLTLSKYTSDGLLDTSYGTNGNITINLARDKVYAVFVAPDNSITVAGIFEEAGVRSVLFAKYLANGAPDETFGDNGSVISPFVQDEYIFLSEILQLDNQSFLITFKIEDSDENEHFYLAKFLANGTVDTAFGANGIAETPFSSDLALLTASTIVEGGKILTLHFRQQFTGPTENFFTRFNENGSLDTFYGNDGVRTTPFNDFIPSKIITQENGRLLIPGGSLTKEAAYPTMRRFYSDGFVDEGFFSQALQDFDFTEASLTSAGKIVGVGTTPFYTGSIDLVIFRYNNNVLGIQENTKTNFTVSPNPTNDVITISCAECSLTNKRYQITDATGKNIRQGVFSVENPTISMEGLSTGLYYITIEDTTLKILKQ